MPVHSCATSRYGLPKSEMTRRAPSNFILLPESVVRQAAHSPVTGISHMASN